eukprot:scaffold2348_cov114-Isochrysis_galbana.AAC.4
MHARPGDPEKSGRRYAHRAGAGPPRGKAVSGPSWDSSPAERGCRRDEQDGGLARHKLDAGHKLGRGTKELAARSRNGVDVTQAHRAVERARGHLSAGAADAGRPCRSAAGDVDMRLWT